MSTVNKWPMVLLWVIQSNVLLNSVYDGTLFSLLIQPYDNGFVMVMPYWLFSSIFKILDENLFNCLFPLMLISMRNFSFSVSFNNIFLSKASLVLTQLNPPINIFSKGLTKSASVSNAVQPLLLLRWTQPENELALLHFFGLYLNIFLINQTSARIVHKELWCLENYKFCWVLPD